MDANPDHIAQQSVYVILKDYEQEVCFILVLWAMAILLMKWRNVHRQSTHLQLDFIGWEGDSQIQRQDVLVLSEKIRNYIGKHTDEYLLPRVLLTALDRFGASASIQDVSTEIGSQCEEESSFLESEMSIIRYIAWAIPSIGFIGTVRGIGAALAQAHRAVDGDISGVTHNLGVAFNSTLVALLISIILMLCIHYIQLHQERLVLQTKRYCDKHLLAKLDAKQAA